MRTPNDDEKIVGLLLKPDLVVDRTYRGFGIGRALIAAELLLTGGIPTWEHDKPGYSPAGAATVRAGVDLARTLSPAPEESPSPEIETRKGAAAHVSHDRSIPAHVGAPPPHATP
jgi:GNAT superfamily N-acetyltransferase